VTARSELRLALLLDLVGAGLVLLAAGRGWVVVTEPSRPPLPTRVVRLSGGELTALRPLAALGLAGVVALAATQNLGRVLVGVVLAASGAGVVVGTLRLLGDPGAAAARSRTLIGMVETTGWPFAAVVGGVLLGLAGLLVAARGRRWAALSARYEAPAAQAEQEPARPEVAAWDALDRGEDPTRT